MTRDADALLSVAGLSAAYGKRAVLHGVSLEVRQGEIVALVGANGAGKTTTLSAIMGLLPAVSGTVSFDGTSFGDLAVERRVARGISLVQEGRQTVPQLTVAENLAIGAYLRRDRDVAADVAHVYALFPRLAERHRQPAGTLSGGEQQMLAIGRALMARPRLLLLDEPSMGLAPKIIAQIFRIIEQIRAEGTTVLLVEQNAREALAMADRAYVLEQGRVVLSGDGATVAADPAVLDAYLGGRQAA
ncbi:ABC transporter ATP-binding protein [Cupriavidus pauculus]|uniref:ABC transporter ATP-binding protein n=1 Tax=Cupriavidus pauculus TaxID=82633 RepID=A0A5P2H8N4_9BURK|nr:ABC transporter ATP-binding protein [Cupriavidus pauculus]QET04316.1 ABC transporter ATP-binding protein [Cupriavidus pauculus]